LFLGSRAARRWRTIGLAATAAAGAAFAWQLRSAGPARGGSLWGLGWGAGGLALILVLLAFGWRKRAYRSTLGTLEGWLQAHIWLGVLALVVVTFHAGRLRWSYEDRLAGWTFRTMVAVAASGAFGVGLYSLFPRLLTDAGTNRSAAQISEQLNQIAQSMARLAAGMSAVFQGLYRRLSAEGKPGLLAVWRILAGGRRARAGPGEDRAFKRLLGEVPIEEREELRQLLVLSRQHKELLAGLVSQQYYRNWLEVWLWVHVPLSIAVLALAVVHAVVAMYYRGV
jgi:hypothetical protein